MMSATCCFRRPPVWRRAWAPLVAVLLLSVALPGPAAFADTLLERESVQDYLREVAREHDLDQHRLAALFVGLETNEEVLELMRRPAERSLEWHEYRPIFLGEDRIEAGRRFLEEHSSLFDAATQRYGVPASVIAAIIGVETFYGRITGRFEVLDALATLAFDHPPRAEFFRSELTEFLRLGTREGWDLDGVLGSYAGAMGLPQFISSSYRRYAVDFDEDGVTDLFDSIPDVIGSVANYLDEHGWVAGEGIADVWVDAPAEAAGMVTRSLKPAIAAQDVAALGFDSEGLNAARESGAPVSVMQFDNGAGEDTLIGYTNFYAITRYNHSRLYARAVLALALELDPRTR